ncbi:MazG family protein [Jatrophihabitans sp. YIM 134969]
MSRPAGEALLAAAAVMDRLRSPGGCPWDAEQTHASLAPYLVEETYETLDALEAGDLDALREELGDVLLQVLFHARIAAETPVADGGFDIDDVAQGLVDKMTRRHPHVFADGDAATADDVARNWEQLKQAEKARSSVTEGIASGQPALAWAAALHRRARRTPATAAVPAPAPVASADDAAAAVIGADLFEIVGRAVAQGVDPESALRATARTYREALLAAEATASDEASPR